MTKIEVFDPPMCCSTGVCGPAPDERLAQFSADLNWLKEQGVQVRRFNLAQEPAAFVGQPEVARVLRDTDGEGLPVVIVDERLVSQGVYPSRQQLAEWTRVLTANAPVIDAAGLGEMPRASRPALPSLAVVQPGGGCCGGNDTGGHGCC